MPVKHHAKQLVTLMCNALTKLFCHLSRNWMDWNKYFTGFRQRLCIPCISRPFMDNNVFRIVYWFFFHCQLSGNPHLMDACRASPQLRVGYCYSLIGGGCARALLCENGECRSRVRDRQGSSHYYWLWGKADQHGRIEVLRFVAEVFSCHCWGQTVVRAAWFERCQGKQISILRLTKSLHNSVSGGCRCCYVLRWML